MTEKKTSEYGKGFVYCLFLFAKHWWRHMNDMRLYKEMRQKNPSLFSESSALSLWFNGAADHLFELEIPEKFKKIRIGKLAMKLQKQGLEWRISEEGLDEKSFDKYFEDMETLMMLIDKELGVEVIEAQWK